MVFRVTFVILISALFSTTAQAQLRNKVELEDVNVRGEAVRTNGLNLSSRARNNLDGRVQMRKDFRDRVLEDFPSYYSSRELAHDAPASTDK